MYSVKISEKKLRKEIFVPPSKSLSHRALIAASLCSDSSEIENIILSEDILATIDALRRFGANIEVLDSDLFKERKKIIFNSKIDFSKKDIEIDSIESGSTLRFMIPISLLFEGTTKFWGKNKLVERPLTPYYDIFDKEGIFYKNNCGKLPLEVSGTLKPSIFKIRGDISSQFITGLMFALPLLDGDSKIEIEGNLESKGYIDLTMDVLKYYGIEIINKKYKEFIIKGNQEYIAKNYVVEGDYSQAAFWIVAGVIFDDINIKGLKQNTKQGDKAILDVILNMGGKFEFKDDVLKVYKSSTHFSIIDGAEFPDIIPIIAVLASISKGKTIIKNASRLRIKESDRLNTIFTELSKLGANIIETEDGLIIDGVKRLNGAVTESHNDHRIAMSIAIASLMADGEVIIEKADAIKKSYPNFWEEFFKK